MKGYVQVYTGNGKGKTTAALGLALRAAGAGIKVYFAQFVKGMKYSEFDAIARLKDLITVKQYGRRCFIHDKPEEKDIKFAKKGLKEVKEIMSSGKYHYKISNEEMLEEALLREDLIRPEKFMEIWYNKDTMYRFIDLRSSPEFLEGHLKNAIHIPIHKILSDEYNDILNQVEKINVLYYSDHCGACGPWMIFKQLGYKNNKILTLIVLAPAPVYTSQTWCKWASK